MCVIIPTWCRIHCTSLGLVQINTGPFHVIWFYCCSYTGISNQHNVSPSLYNISTEFDVRYNPLRVLYTLHVTRISPYKHCTLHVIWFYSFQYTGISNQHNVSRRYFTYLGNWMCVIIPSWCRLHCTSLGLVHINTWRCHVIIILLLFIYRCK
jgi:hypothetical protein